MSVYGTDVNSSLEGLLATSKKGLLKHKEQADANIEIANETYKVRSNIGESLSKNIESYNKVVASKTQINDTQQRMSKMSSTLETHRINTQATKRMMVGIVQQFNNETGKTGKDITDLQLQVETYVKSNTEEVLQMVQDERQFYHDTLYSVKARKGLVLALRKAGIDLNRQNTLIATGISGIIGFIFGKKI